MKSDIFLVLNCLILVVTAYKSNRFTFDLPDGAEIIVAKLQTKFKCISDGYYADIGHNCEIFHVCNAVQNSDGNSEVLQWSFLCSNDTIFDQSTLTCKHPENSVACKSAKRYYHLNANTETGSNSLLHRRHRRQLDDEDYSVPFSDDTYIKSNDNWNTDNQPNSDWNTNQSNDDWRNTNNQPNGDWNTKNQPNGDWNTNNQPNGDSNVNHPPYSMEQFTVKFLMDGGLLIRCPQLGGSAPNSESTSPSTEGLPGNTGKGKRITNSERKCDCKC